jgi:arylsulfatase A-like enzyme
LALATHGTRFSNAFTQVPLTLPAHASLLTGRYPDEHGVWNNASYFVKPTERTLAEILQERGYRTGAVVGSWILNRHSGLSQGFGEFADVTDRNARHKPWAAGLERPAEAVVGDALSWIGSEGFAPPYFLWVHLYDPHWPWEPPAGFAPGVGSDRRALYEAEVAYADRAVGQLLRGLNERGMLKRTLVVLTADHGESLDEHGEPTHGYYIYDAVMRVPLVLWGPGLVPSGLSVAEPVELIDVLPTVLSLLGVASTEPMGGRDLSPLVRGLSVARTPVYGASLYPWMLGDFCPIRSVLVDGWKYIHGPDPELYHLEHDRAESRNLARDQAQGERVAQLRSVLEGLRARMTLAEGATRILTYEDEDRLRALGYVAAAEGSRAAESESCSRDAKIGFPLDRGLQAAKQLAHEGRPEEAAAQLREILDAEPGHREAQLALTVVLGLSGNRAEALRESRRLVEISGNSPYHLHKGWKNIGTLLEREGRLGQARDAVSRAIEADARDPEAWVLLGRLALRLGDREQARRAYEAAQQLAPEDPKVLAGLEQLSSAPATP